MFVSLKKIWGYFLYFFQAKKVWTWPQQSEVVIYDDANSEILLEYLKPWNPETLHVRNEQINILVLICSLFRDGRRPDAYKDCFIESVRPKLVVTTIDNNANFYAISKRHPDIKTLFIQNGLRSYYCDAFEWLDNQTPDILNNFYVDHMLVFGSVIGEKYSQYIEGDIALIGSLKNNFVQKKKPQKKVIAFVSLWRKNQGFYMGDKFCSFEGFWEKPDKLVIQWLMQYANKNNKQLMIVASSSYDSNLFKQEEAYYAELMGCEPKFLNLSESCSSYKAIDLAEIVVSMESTLGLESIARGIKTALFFIRGTQLGIPSLNYGWPGDFPDEGPFWTNKDDPDSFERILDYIYEVSDEQWQEDLKSTNFSSIINYDPGNKILQSILEKELGSPPALDS